MRPVHTTEPDTTGATWTIYEINTPTNPWVAFRYDTTGRIRGGTYRGPTYDYALAHVTRERNRTT